MDDDRVRDYASDLRALTNHAAHGTVEQVVDQALANLERIVRYDLAAVLELTGRRLAVRYARGRLMSDRVRAHSIDLDTHPRLSEALRQGRAMAVTEEVHATEGDPYDGVLDLPDGHSCMVVPLRAGDRSIGAVTLDREVCEAYPTEVVDLVSAYADILALVISCAEQSDLLDRYRRQLEERNRLLVAEQPATDATRTLQGCRSPAMAELLDQARLVAATSAPVLIGGETGAGKEVLARAIHDWSPRRDGPFVATNCAAIPESLVESELFGHVRGAFTGAERDRPGRFVTADRGTLLLDEIGDLPLAAQGKLLRVLQEGTLQPVGSDRTVRVDVRVLAATHVDLRDAVREHRFREDLYYRLAVFPVVVPPLRERREDIVRIARSLLDRLERGGGGPWTLSPAAAAALEAGQWPGNVRELANVLERATILRPHGELGPELLSVGTLAARREEGEGPVVTLDDAVRAHLERALRRTGGKIYGVDGAAALLGLAPSTLQNRMRKLRVDHARFR
ncbi:MAG: sigma 54-interacting transcriptional regulator [Alphaproteobacteria bacterium]|nr:sigma 54-interacting transcriptional regulator [Alphaproteobacteria bacterium]MCB9695641.1 sigma 54-interacting transcriptional regulator [Alphaproteobacteria bacterium]